MNYKQSLGNLIRHKPQLCVSISLKTHRTHPDNLADEIRLKNLLKEAENKLETEFAGIDADKIIKNLKDAGNEVDHNKNLESLHIFVSDDSKEVFRSPWPAPGNSVTVADHFNLMPLIKVFNRSENYYILLLSQSGAIVYEAINKNIVGEIKNGDFPFPESGFYPENAKRASDADYMDNLLRNYLRDVDRAAKDLYESSGLNFVVVSTENNFSLLRQVAGKPSIYIGYTPIDYNNQTPEDIIVPAWEVAKAYQEKLLNEAINQLKEDAGKKGILTDPEQIFEAVAQGRGAFLLVSEKAQKKLSENILVSKIIAEVISKNGWVYFLGDEFPGEEDVLLKTRY